MNANKWSSVTIARHLTKLRVIGVRGTTFYVAIASRRVGSMIAIGSLRSLEGTKRGALCRETRAKRKREDVRATRVNACESARGIYCKLALARTGANPADAS